MPDLQNKPFDLDGRLKLVLLIASCFVSQYLPAPFLPVWLAALAALFIPKKKRGRNLRFMLHGGLIFILFWLMMTIGSDLIGGKGWKESFLLALPLGARLLALTLVGIAYVEYASPIETGRAAAWFLKPILGTNAWRPALAIALTAWFLPQSLRLSSDIRLAMQARGLQLSWWKRATLLLGASLRILEQKADHLAIALASRRLDDHRSWLPLPASRGEKKIRSNGQRICVD